MVEIKCGYHRQRHEVNPNHPVYLFEMLKCPIHILCSHSQDTLDSHRMLNGGVEHVERQCRMAEWYTGTAIHTLLKTHYCEYSHCIFEFGCVVRYLCSVCFWCSMCKRYALRTLKSIIFLIFSRFWFGFYTYRRDVSIPRDRTHYIRSI